MTVQRDIAPHVLALSRSFPIVTITGPRQSGKTTLCRQLFPDKPYVSLEALDQRAFATGDPRGFLEAHSAGAVIDEVQRAPDLLSYLQVEVDERRAAGRFVLTGSANLALLESVSQSLAGRTGLVTLLPCSRPEYERFPGQPPSLWNQVWRGGFPAIPDRSISPPVTGSRPTWHLSHLHGLSQLVESCSGIRLQKTKPVVGEHAFSHESGIHIAAILEDPRTYEYFMPEMVGGERRFILGKHTGKKAL